MPTCIPPTSQRWSIAGRLTLQQPCEAGVDGTEVYPWTAMAPLKYCGRYKLPRAPLSQAFTRRNIWKVPEGVTATCHAPACSYRWLDPVLVL